MILQNVCDIIQTWMELDDDQVYVYNQKVMIPSDYRIYIVVGILNNKCIGTSRDMVPSTNGLVERISSNMQATLSIDIFSKSQDAITRKEEIIQSLSSTYSLQKQTELGFLIARHTSSFTNLSGIEGAAIPYRFNLSVNVQYLSQKTGSIDFYDTFEKDILTEE